MGSFAGVWYSLPLSKPRDRLVSLVRRQFQGNMAMNDCSQWVDFMSVVGIVRCSPSVFMVRAYASFPSSFGVLP